MPSNAPSEADGPLGCFPRFVGLQTNMARQGYRWCLIADMQGVLDIPVPTDDQRRGALMKRADHRTLASYFLRIKTMAASISTVARQNDSSIFRCFGFRRSYPEFLSGRREAPGVARRAD